MKPLLPLFFATLLASALAACQAPSQEDAQTFALPTEADIKNPAMPAKFVDTTGNRYAWNHHYHIVHTLHNRVQPPDGFQRVELDKDSFGAWLRDLPTLPGKPDVLLYNGQLKGNQSAHHLVLDIDVGQKDLQQCADAVMRLRAEYLWSQERFADIHFNFTSGHTSRWTDWKAGKRPVVNGNSVSFVQKADADGSYANFMRYMTDIFNWAGTSSLSKELKPVKMNDMQVGDVLIHGGFPGHAVLVVDMAENPETGKKVYMVVQSYMPAQQIHLLRNPMDGKLSPWYELGESGAIETPEWGFSSSELMRFQ